MSILDETGAVAIKYSYDEFGQTTVDGNYTFGNEICYTGGIYDWSSGQYYLNARYYDPGTGRFLSEDTYRGDVNEPNTLHLYAYCANNPINYVDPSGHWAGATHEAMTERVFGWVNTKKLILKNLLYGSTAPDRLRHKKGLRNWMFNETKFHGHSPALYEVRTLYINSAVYYYKEKNYKLASWYLGVAIHSVQDYWAHTVKDNTWGRIYYRTAYILKGWKPRDHKDTFDNIYRNYNGREWKKV